MNFQAALAWRLTPRKHSLKIKAEREHQRLQMRPAMRIEPVVLFWMRYRNGWSKVSVTSSSAGWVEMFQYMSVTVAAASVAPFSSISVDVFCRVMNCPGKLMPRLSRPENLHVKPRLENASLSSAELSILKRGTSRFLFRL